MFKSCKLFSYQKAANHKPVDFVVFFPLKTLNFVFGTKNTFNKGNEINTSLDYPSNSREIPISRRNKDS